jgi:hypothetical protein
MGKYFDFSKMDKNKCPKMKSPDILWKIPCFAA